LEARWLFGYHCARPGAKGDDVTRRADALATLPCAPAAFRLAEAAAYVGVSVSHFLKARKEGTMPNPRLLEGVPVYLRRDLDEYLAMLPEEGTSSLPGKQGVDDWREGDAA
jgi:predicted DNA-binding transcriptional regulator AlpA